MYTEINAALQSAKVISEWLKANKSLKNYNELEAAISDITSKLASSNQALLASLDKQKTLTDRIASLEKDLADKNDFERKAERYALHEFETEVFAYKLKPEMAEGEPIHYICAKCKSDGKLYILQPLPSRLDLFCQSCKKTIRYRKNAGK